LDIDDVRESPALDVIELLRQRGADVRYHDPYVPTIRHNGCEMAGQAGIEAALNAALRRGFPLPLVEDSLWLQGKLLAAANCMVAATACAVGLGRDLGPGGMTIPQSEEPQVKLAPV